VGGAHYLPRTSSSSGGLVARSRRSSESPALSLASQNSSLLRGRGEGTGSSGRTQRAGSRPRSPGTPLYSKDLGLSEPGKAPTQDASDSEDYLRNKLMRSASDEGLNIPSTPEFSFDGNLSTSPYPVLDRRGSRVVSPTSPASESSSYQASGRSEQDSYTTHSERSYPGRAHVPGQVTSDGGRKYFTSDSERARNTELEETLLRTGYYMPEYKH